MEKTKLAYQNMVKEGYDPEYAKAVTTYLALAVDRLAIYSTSLGYWHTTREIINPALQRQALNMVWTYVELNPFSEASGDWISAINWITQVIKHCSSIGRTASAVLQGTATRLPFDDKFFDAVITDPPYYDNVPYSDFSNFFYVFLKRTVGDLYPELFSTPLAPKSEELIQNTTLLRRSTHINPLEYEQMGIKDQDYFERELTRALIEMHRVLRDDGIAVIVFAHKSTEAWETVINSLLKSGLVLVASWPVHTEMQARMRARESATLASSIYMVCRKRLKQETAYFNDLRELINHRIKERLNRFWDEGIGGSDFFTSAIGPAVEVFGRYSRVEKLSGEEVSVKELLDYVRKVVSEFALERILKKPDLGGVDAETRFYLLWRWTFGNAKVHFDDAIKLSRPMGVELTQLWDRGEFVKKEKEFIKVLTPQERAKDPTFLRKTKFTSMIDVLHYVLVLWERGEREKIKEILNETGYAGNEMFWQTAQAISEVLPKGDKEKQLLQGFLYGKEVYVKEARGKTSLLDYMESG
jgi:adenine-specific DNA methylase